jgi:hypothetical protein
MNESGVAVKPVMQLERTGCGIASVAALAGTSYRQAQRTANQLGIFAKDRRLWSETQPVRTLLKRYRIRAGTEIPFVSWSALPDLALVAIKWHREGGRAFWHWVVFVREKDRSYVLDSKRALKAHVRTDFGRMRPKWSIRIEKIRSRR